MHGPAGKIGKITETAPGGDGESQGSGGGWSRTRGATSKPREGYKVKGANRKGNNEGHEEYKGTLAKEFASKRMARRVMGGKIGGEGAREKKDLCQVEAFKIRECEKRRTNFLHAPQLRARRGQRRVRGEMARIEMNAWEAGRAVSMACRESLGKG